MYKQYLSMDQKGYVLVLKKSSETLGAHKVTNMVVHSV